MKMKLKNIIYFKSLKNRLKIFLVCSSIIPIFLIGALTLYKVYDLYQENLSQLIHNELNKMKENIEVIMETMINMSQQLVYDGQIGKKLYLYLDEEEGIEKVNMLKYLNEQIAIYELANPKIANITYFYIGDKNQLKKINSSLAKEALPLEQEQLSKQGEMVFYGPHQTASVASIYDVISLVRKVRVGGYQDVLIYIESGYKQMEEILENTLEDLDAIYLITSDNGQVIYRSSEEELKVLHDYASFSVEAQGGWKISILVPKVNYYKKLNALVFKYCIIIAISVIGSIGIACGIWQSIYKPFNQFNKELKDIDAGQVKEQLEILHIEELDENLQCFNKMRENILNLIKYKEKEESEKTELQIKQLFYKINPHFIHNTLLSLRWYAESRNYQDIVCFISALNKLLMYNMEKDKETTIQQELDSVKAYITLQRIRYNIDFEMVLNVPEMVLKSTIPRFILQPLIENAIFYGEEEKSIIKLIVALQDSGKISIKVMNKGNPLDEEKIKKILTSSEDTSRNGIGLQYVVRILKDKFGLETAFNVSRVDGEKNQVEIVIPYSRGELYVKDIGSRG